MITVENLGHAFGDQVILQDISLKVHAAEVASLVGPSGCGKSTLLRLIAGLEEVQKGHINIHEQRLSVVFQDSALMPWCKVFANAALPLSLSGSVDRDLVMHVLAQVGLRGLENRYPHQLSGGQKMRVSVARALISGAKTILMDEPFAALDEFLRFDMNDLLLRLVAEEDLSILFVTHSLYEAVYLSDRIYALNKGKVAGEITTSHDRNLSPYAQRGRPAFADSVAHLTQILGGVSNA